MTREMDKVLMGASSRAAVHLLQASKVRALMGGRSFVIPDDVKFVCRPVLRHRLTLQPDAYVEGSTSDDVLTTVLERVEVPRWSGIKIGLGEPPGLSRRDKPAGPPRPLTAPNAGPESRPAMYVEAFCPLCLASHIVPAALSRRGVPLRPLPQELRHQHKVEGHRQAAVPTPRGSAGPAGPAPPARRFAWSSAPVPAPSSCSAWPRRLVALLGRGRRPGDVAAAPGHSAGGAAGRAGARAGPQQGAAGGHRQGQAAHQDVRAARRPARGPGDRARPGPGRPAGGVEREGRPAVVAGEAGGRLHDDDPRYRPDDTSSSRPRRVAPSSPSAITPCPATSARCGTCRPIG